MCAEARRLTDGRFITEPKARRANARTYRRRAACRLQRRIQLSMNGSIRADARAGTGKII
jgi:hypothetical protein